LNARLIIATSLVGALAAIASGTTTSLTSQVQNTLTTIDTVPTRQQIDTAFGNQPNVALQNLTALAADGAADVGIRLRAIHALAKYCAATPCTTSDAAHQSLATLIEQTRTETAGAQLLLLRAGIETLGTMHVAADVTTLVPLLEHPSRDIRASTAKALQDLCNTQASSPLRVRYARESSEQVKLAISEALRILGQCSATP
jgi:hypothetical protein